MIEKLNLRLRFFLFFAALTLGGWSALALGLWVGWTRTGGPVDGYLIAGLIAGFGILGCAAWVSYLFDENIARPILGLSAELHTRAMSNVAVGIDAGQARYLGALAPAAQAIHAELELVRKNQETAFAQKSKRLLRDKSVLEGLLRDVDRGVIVLAHDQTVRLFNAAAESALGPIGLCRPLQTYMDSAPVATALEQLGCAAVPFQTVTCNDGRRISGMVAPVYNDGEKLGTLVMFNETHDLKSDQVADRPTPTVNPLQGGLEHPPLSDFYDFDFDLSDADMLDRPLEQVVYTVFDTETTGLDTAKDDVIQIAAVRMLGTRVLDNDVFDQLVDPKRPIPAASTAIHGITKAMVAGQPEFFDVAEGFAKFAEDAVFVAHNAPFDMEFLRRLEGLEHPVLCTARLSAALFDHTGAHTLDALAARLGIEIDASVRHTAIGDALITTKVFQLMIPLLQARGVKSLGDAIAVQGGPL